MSTDPLSTYEAAEADAVERQDEARREQHWREAERHAKRLVKWMSRNIDKSCLKPMLIASSGISHIDGASTDRRPWTRAAGAVELEAFEADYGTPALLRVIATALEAK